MKLEEKNIRDILALTPMQEGMLFHYLKNPESGHYFQQLSLEISGNVDVDCVERAWNLVIDTNEMLRTLFRWQKLKEPTQIILKKHRITIRYYENANKDSDQWIEKIKANDRNESFDLRQVPFRVTLCKIHHRKYVMIISHHHILYDGWSTGIILNEFLAAYEDPVNKKDTVMPVKTKLKEFIRWHQQRAKEIKVKEEKFWKDYLVGFDTPSKFSIKRPIIGESKEAVRYQNRVARHLKGQLEQFLKKYKITLAALLYSAWGIILQKYNNSDDVMFGTTAAGRTAKIKGIEDMVGLFINTLPLRVQTYTDEKIADFLGRINNLLRGREAYERTSLLNIKEYSGIDGDEEIFDTVFVVENYPLDTRLDKENRPLSIDSYSMVERTHYDLTVGIMPKPAEILIDFSFPAELFEPAQIERLSHHYLTVMENLIKTPNQRIPDIEILSAEEKKQVLFDFNETEADYPKDKTIHQLFEETAKGAPDRTALVGKAREEWNRAMHLEGTRGLAPLSRLITITYSELNEKSNQLAHLLREKGVKPDTIVALMVERSAEMIIGILGILKAGGAYLPIDEDYPEERINYMLTDSKVQFLLTHNPLRRFNCQLSIVNCQLSMKKETQPAVVFSSPQPAARSPQLAYVIYTSGSTGRPKGVLINHDSVLNLIHCQQQRFNIDEKDRILQFSSICFDASVEQIFLALFNGAVLVLTDKNILLDITKFEKYISLHFISHLHAVPSFLNILKLQDCYHVKRVVSGGDVCPVSLAKKWYNTCEFYNEYGPTETTVTSIETLIKDVPGAMKSVPIGRPLDNTIVYILDQWRKPVPLGAAGELSIGGDGLARGYLNNPELTAKKFLPALYRSYPSHMSYIYLTGDLARWLSDGNIEFLGRIDHQVKIRGFRIELGEIENQLLAHHEIKEVVVSRKINKKGNPYLCAYIVPLHSHGFERFQLRNYLSGKLPDYMIPAFFEELSQIPLTSTGKVDRKSLPEPGINSSTAYIAPRIKTEEIMVDIWSDILQIEKEKIGIDDSFFELGGHSLKATRLMSRIHKAFDVEIPIEKLFETPTIRDLCFQIQEREKQVHQSIQLTEEKDYYPLTSAQKRFYVFQQLNPTTTSYNVVEVMKMQGKLSKEEFETIFKTLIRRHESLRTSFHLVDGEPAQRILHRIKFEIGYYQADNRKEVKPDSIIDHFIRPFDLKQSPLLRLGLHKTLEDTHVLMFDMHHIISDGVSVGILVKEFLALYRGEKLVPMHIQYKDYVKWRLEQKRRAPGHQTKMGLKTEHQEEVLHLPLDYPRPTVPSFKGNTIKFGISPQVTKVLKRLSLKENTTLYMILLGVFNVFLAKLSGQEHIVVGSPMAGRMHRDLEGLIGLFINTLTLTNFPSGDKRFSDFLKEVKKNSIQAFATQDYQYEELVEKFILARDAGRNPLFDIMFVLQNMEMPEIEIPDVNITRDIGPKTNSKFDMTLYCEEKDNLVFRLEYSTSLFKQKTILRFIRYFQHILTCVLKDPEKRISGIEMVPQDEKRELLFDFNDTVSEYPKEKKLQDLFMEQVNRTPNRIALIGLTNPESESRNSKYQLTYGELNNKTNQLALLLQEKGVVTDTIVGILVERSIEMIIGILAILKAGGAYLPIDPGYPEDRIDYMLSDSKATILLKKDNIFRYSHGEQKELLVLDFEHLNFEFVSDFGFRISDLNASNLAYVIYTSGSTGKPKGVMIEQHSVVNRLNWMQRYYPINEADVILQKTPFVFDVSVWELFWWGHQGASLYILGSGGEKSPRVIVKAVEKNKITTMHFVPSMLTVFLHYLAGTVDVSKLKSLKQVFASGEALEVWHVEQFSRTLNKNGTILINLYGPTEATVDVSYFNCPLNEVPSSIPIGKPIDNIVLYIFNRYRQLQPIGIAGELAISGVGLARGYLNRPALTAEKFDHDLWDYQDPQLKKSKSFSGGPGGRFFKKAPLAAGGRIYKTGDLAKWLPDGNILFLGRIDHQVKIRGFRIELKEIESQLLDHHDVKETVVIAKESKAGDKYLCAYIVPGKRIESTELTAYLSARLPDYMIPSYFVMLEEIPLTTNGKIDRKSLPQPEVTSAVEYAAPRDGVEDLLVNMWSEILGLDRKQIGIHDNFFQLGGHSLNAAALQGRIYRQFSVEIPLTEMFKVPTIKGISGYLNKVKPGSYISIEPAAKKDYYPLSSPQKRLYVIQQIEPESTSYNMPAIMILEGKLHRKYIENTFRKLINRHESLRTCFDAVDDRPVQRIQDKVEFEIEYYDASQVEEGRSLVEGTRGIAPLFIKPFIRPFDLSRAPLLRVGLIKLKEEEHILMADMHHIISDAISKEILVKELMNLYRGETVPPLKLQYKDFSQWQNSQIVSGWIKKQEEYWLHEFKGKLPVMELPIDFKRPGKRSFAGNRETFEIPGEEARKLRELAEKEHATMFMVILALYNILLSKLGLQADIIVGTIIAGRRHPDLENIIGGFINTLALRNYPKGDKTFIEFLREVRKRTLDAFDNQDYQFEDLVEKLKLQRETSRTPLFDVLFSFRARDTNRPRESGPGPAGKPQEPRLNVKAYTGEQETEAKFDMIFTGGDTGEELFFLIEYSTGLFKKETIERFIKYFKEVLSAVLINGSIQLKNIKISHHLVTATSTIYQTSESDFDF